MSGSINTETLAGNSSVSELPKAWVCTSIGQIANVTKLAGFEFTNYFQYQDFGEIRVVRGLNIGFGNFKTENFKYIDISTSDNLPRSQLLSGDLLITYVGTLGSVAILPKDNFRYHLGPNVGKIRVSQEITDAQFVMFYLLSPLGNREIHQTSKAVAQSSLSMKQIRLLSIPLPPLNEQRRIVAKLDSLFVRSRRARGGLERIPKLCDRYKQAVLAAACSGRLTADWREQNSNIETASELLRRIQEESIQRKRQIKIGEGIADLFDLPESWKWVRLFDICRSITDGAHLPPPQTEEGVPFLTISNITTGRINFDKTRYVPESYYQKIDETRKPYEGDILYTVVGATYGTPVFINTKERFCFQRHIAILKPSLLIDSQYLFYTLKSHLVYKQATDAVTGTAQPTVPLSGLRPIKVPLPPLTEQKEIVRRLEELFQAIDVLWQEYQKAS